MTAIKICGITRAEDAAAAVALGANALGFIFWPDSARYIDLRRVERIVSALAPFVTPVGVFVSPTIDQIEQAARVGIRVAQVHGDMPMWRADWAPVSILRAVHLAPDASDTIEPAVPMGVPIILDVHDPVRHGGTGLTVNWMRARAVAASRTMVLAGGLNPTNVGEAIRTVRPYAVDVSSGVEASPGIKDHDLLRAFITAVKETV